MWLATVILTVDTLVLMLNLGILLEVSGKSGHHTI